MHRLREAMRDDGLFPHRYFAEFDFRHNNRIALGVDDKNGATELAKGIVGKRLTYRRPNSKEVQA